PLASAIVDSATRRGLPLSPVESFAAVPGKGITGVVQGHALAIGNERLMQEWGVDTEPLSDWTAERAARAESVVFVNVDGALGGALAVADPVRGTSRKAVR